MVCLALIFNNTDNGTLVLYVHVYEVFERCLLPESLQKTRLFYIKRYYMIFRANAGVNTKQIDMIKC